MSTQQPEAREFTMSQYASKDCMIGAMRERIAELESQLESSGFTAADMATAEARGFRDGVASVAASAGEPVAWLDPWTGAKVTTDYDAYGKHGIPLYTAPQPMERESAEFGRFLSDVLTAAGLVTHGKQCKALGERLADMCAKLRHHGIKGGQHDAEWRHELTGGAAVRVD